MKVEAIVDNGQVKDANISGTMFRGIADHILHFYILSGLDYIDPARVLEYEGGNKDLNTLKYFLQQGYSNPFLPRDDIDYKFDAKTTNMVVSHYIKALDIYRKTQQAA